MGDLPERRRELGEFIREQRAAARLSLRRLSDMAEILQQIAKALRISAESLYVRAGILEERGEGSDLVAAILGDQTLTGDQKQTLVGVYRSFHVTPDPEPAPEPDEPIGQRPAGEGRQG